MFVLSDCYIQNPKKTSLSDFAILLFSQAALSCSHILHFLKDPVRILPSPISQYVCPCVHLFSPLIVVIQ